MRSVLSRWVRFFPVLLFFIMVHLDAIAGGICPVCLEEVRDETVVSHSSIQCGHEHSIHTACLSAQVKSYEDLRELRDHGLQCPGGGAEARGGRCAERIPLAKIREILSPEEGKAETEIMASPLFHTRILLLSGSDSIVNLFLTK